MCDYAPDEMTHYGYRTFLLAQRRSEERSILSMSGVLFSFCR